MRVLLLLAACGSENRLHTPDPQPVADPPGREEDVFGSPPDWASCTEAYLGQYYNLETNHPLVAAEEDTGGALNLELVDPAQAALWEAEALAFQRYDVSLAFGENWWPVDEEIAADPAYFAARWTAWLRAWESGDVEVALGASTDGWVMLDDAVVAEVGSRLDYQPETVTFSLRAGVYPLDVRMAHRGGGNAAFRFRVVSGDVSVCYPEFGEEEG